MCLLETAYFSFASQAPQPAPVSYVVCCSVTHFQLPNQGHQPAEEHNLAELNQLWVGSQRKHQQAPISVNSCKLIVMCVPFKS